ncbi:hypothetical protein [Arthrobacter glacialis]|uniref:hypothetical protein n=1 Tax=Arthrobacter glacialis TaxID=1664 RepID=UPI000CD40652|nr:hypothetical protein [Arthrobacter glacialis]POH58269.1 hypothetical protein CVS28_12565 [Arthrobacter glacialis]
MDALATLAELKKHWPSLPAEQEADAEQKLIEASIIVRGLYPVDARIASGALDPATAAYVVCDMVKTAMDIDETDVPADVTQLSFGAGGFTQSATFKDRDGKLFLTKLHRQLLSGGGSRNRKAFTIIPGV